MRLLVSLVFSLVLFAAQAHATCSAGVTNCQADGVWTIGSGGELDVESGGELDVESGGSFKIGGVAVTATAAELNSVDASAGTGLTLQNGESINTNTDDVFDFTRDDAGTVTLTASDDDSTAALTVLPGGAAALTLGGASTTSVTVTTDGAGFGVDTTADAATLTASGTNTATFVGADAAGAANTALDTTGAGAITIGSADVTAITLTTDGTGTAEVVLPAASVGSAEIALSEFVGSDPGATCTAGHIYIDTDETVDTNCTTTADNALCLCVATNTWVQLNNN